MGEALLELNSVGKTFYRAGGGFRKRKTVQALDDVTLTLPEEPEVLALVGESGSGKTTLSRIVIGLEQATDGQVLYRGRSIRDWLKHDATAFRKEVQVIFQDPYATYNPIYRVDRVLWSVIKNFNLTQSKSRGLQMITEALEAMGLNPAEVLGRFPHQLSGGQRQRIMLARIWLIRPRLIVADEPVSMLDASLRAMFLEHLSSFRKLGASCLYITHDLNIGYSIADRIMILCQGKAVEVGGAGRVVGAPMHPYTRQLVASIPNPDPNKRWVGRLPAERIGLTELRQVERRGGCIYASRCDKAFGKCSESAPPLAAVSDPDGEHRDVACFLYE